MEEEKISLSRSLRGRMLRQAVLPLLILAFVVGIVGIHTFRTAMLEQVQSQMQAQCHMVAGIYEDMYPGEFKLEVLDETNYNLFKGKVDITDANQLIDNIHDAYGVEVSIFRSDLCVVTTLMQDDKRLTLTKASPVVVGDVLDTGEEKFYSDVVLGGQKYFAYFMPIAGEKEGEYFGMYAIYRLAADVNGLVTKAVLPVVIVIIAATLLIGLFSIRSSQKIVRVLQQLQRFMHGISNGRFDGELSASVLEREDELGDLAKSGQSMQRVLRRLIEYDALTGLYNRRTGNIRLKRAKAHAAEYGTPYCVGICDIDFFKKVNDNYGHDAGDEVLKNVAKLLNKHISSKQSFVARWGGEEFLMVFENCVLKDALKVLQKTLKDIDESTVHCNDKDINVTMSMGIVQANTDAAEEIMLKAADMLLYRCKQNGRNQIQGKDMNKKKETS